MPGADLISQYVTIGEYGAGDGKGVTPISDPVLDSLKSRIVYTASVDGGTTINGDLSTLETGLKTLTVPANGKVTISWEWPHDRYNNGGNIPGDTDETTDGSTTPIGLPTTGNTQPIGQKLADTFGKLGEENATLVSSLGVAAIVIIGILVLKRRRADEKN